MNMNLLNGSGHTYVKELYTSPPPTFRFYCTSPSALMDLGEKTVNILSEYPSTLQKCSSLLSTLARTPCMWVYYLSDAWCFRQFFNHFQLFNHLLHVTSLPWNEYPGGWKPHSSVYGMRVSCTQNQRRGDSCIWCLQRSWKQLTTALLSPLHTASCRSDSV